MSRSNNTELINPAVKFFEWSATSGTVQYFDRETKTNVDVDLPFRFMVLDRVAQVGGGIDRHGSYEGFWSNSVKDTSKQPFTVRSKSGIECQGLYKDIKGKPGIKWITGLYIAFHDDDGDLKIGYFKIKGAALNAWLEFTKSHKNIYDGAFGISDKKKAKKGTNSYFEPVFTHYAAISEESEKAALNLDKHLQEYLTAYLTREPQPEAMAATANGASFYDNPPEMPEPDYSGAPDELEDTPF